MNPIEDITGIDNKRRITVKNKNLIIVVDLILGININNGVKGHFTLVF